LKRVYLITGAAGFVGSCLLRELIRRNEDVHIILRSESDRWRIRDIIDKTTCHISDLSSKEALTDILLRAKPTVIYHLAAHGAYSYQNEADKIVDTNIVGTWHLLQASSRIDYELFVNTGSSSEYGFKRSAMRETDLLEPASYYAVTKCSQTLLCCHFAKQEGKPIVTLRPFSLYGPFEDASRFIPTLMKALLLKKTMKLVAPEVSRDYVYIDDMIEAYLMVDSLKTCAGEIFNIGTGVQSSIKEVVEKAVRVTNETTAFEWGAMQNRMWDTANWVADISKARRMLNWIPKISLEQGLLLTWGWFKEHAALYPPRTV